jgi:ferric-dicitrate binding protein FerR (iron transport regulator)
MVITNTLRIAIGWEAKWIGLAIAEVICLGAAFATGSTGSDFVIAVLNGCLVYLSAAGATAAGATVTQGASVRADARGSNVGSRDLTDQRSKDHSFFEPWL